MVYEQNAVALEDAAQIEKNGWGLDSFVPEIEPDGHLTVVPAHKSSIPPPIPEEARSGTYSIPPPIPKEASSSGSYGARRSSIPPPNNTSGTYTRSSTPPPFVQSAVVLYLGATWKTETGEVLPSPPKGMGETASAMRSIEDVCKNAKNGGNPTVLYPGDLAGYITKLHDPRCAVKLAIVETTGIDKNGLADVVDAAERYNIPLIFYTNDRNAVAPWADRYAVRQKPAEREELVNDAFNHYHKP